MIFDPKEIAKCLQNCRTTISRDPASAKKLLTLLTGQEGWSNESSVAFYISVIETFSATQESCGFLLAMSGLATGYSDITPADARRSYYRKISIIDSNDDISVGGYKYRENKALERIANELVKALENGLYYIEKDTGKLVETTNGEKKRLNDAPDNSDPVHFDEPNELSDNDSVFVKDEVEHESIQDDSLFEVDTISGSTEQRDSNDNSSMICSRNKSVPIRQITRKTIICFLVAFIIGGSILYFILDSISRPIYEKNHPTSETMLDYVSRKIEAEPSYCYLVAQGIIEMLEESGNIHTLDQNTDYRLMAEFVQKTQEKSASSTNGTLIGMAQWYMNEKNKNGNTTQEYASYAEATVNLLNDHLIRHETIMDTVPERHWVVKTYSDPSMIFIEEDNTLPLDSRWVYYDFTLKGDIPDLETKTLFVIGFNQQDYSIGLFDTDTVNYLSEETPLPTYFEAEENTEGMVG